MVSVRNFLFLLTTGTLLHTQFSFPLYVTNLRPFSQPFPLAPPLNTTPEEKRRKGLHHLIGITGYVLSGLKGNKSGTVICSSELEQHINAPTVFLAGGAGQGLAVQKTPRSPLSGIPVRTAPAAAVSPMQVPQSLGWVGLHSWSAEPQVWVGLV